MTVRRLVDFARGIAALTALAGLLVGVPLALVVAVGSPLPGMVPDVSAIGEALTTSGIEDAVVVNVVAVLIWIAWLQVALAFGLEIAAVIRRRPAISLPGGRRVQLAVTNLVTTAALVTSALTATRPVPIASVRLAPPVAVSVSLPAATPDTDLHAAAPVAASRATYLVERRDSLWSIAEGQLGDGLRWRELRDLNAGRLMADGSVLQADSDVIQPGWLLELPNDVAAPSTSSPTTTATVIVAPGDSLWSIAAATAPIDETPAELLARWSDIIDLNREQLADPDNPSVIFAGQEIDVPSEPPPVAAPVVIPPPSTPPLTPLSTNEPSEPLTDVPVQVDQLDDASTVGEVEDDGDGDHSAVSATRLGVAGAAIAASVVAALQLARRRRLRSVPPGFAPQPMDDAHEELRAELMVAADIDAIERRDGALRDLAMSLDRSASDVRPRLVRVADDRVEVLLSRPAVPVRGPWRAEGGGTVWSTEADLHDSPGDDPAPALVSIGVPDDGDQLYLDLESMGVVAVSGSTDEVTALVRSFVTELTTRPGTSDVFAVDLDDVLPGAEAASWDDVADDLLLRAEQVSALLSANRWPTPFRARAAGPDDALTPVVVVLGEKPDDARFEELCRRVTSAPNTVSLVVLGAHPLGVDIEVTDGWLRVPSLDLVCRAQQLDGDTAAEIEDLLDERDEQLVLLDAIDPTPRSFAELGAATHRRPEVFVRLLGEVDVVGGRRPLQPKQVAVVAYIALHAPVTTERVEDAIWPTLTGTRRKRLSNTLSDCRRRLGAAHLPMAADGRYSTGVAVGTDIQEFERLDRLSAQATSEVAIGLLRDALELVRGPVFTYRSADRGAFVWVDTENWLTTWELKVANAALRLSDLALDLDDSDTAVWAAEQGLRCIPTHAALTEALMKAYWRRGDREAAESVYDSHVSALEELEIDDVAETTIDLRDRIKAERSA